MGGSCTSVSVFFIGCLVAFCGCPTTATLRGVATNEWAGGCQDLVLLSNVSWYYNWGMQPSANVANCAFANNRYVEFVPMIWGSGQVTSNIVANLPSNFRYLMAFNEPNFNSQANLMPAQAASLWMQVVTQLQNAGIYNKIKIGAPSASPGGFMSPSLWLQQFFGNCSGCRFDFQNFHVYDCNGNFFNADSLNYWLTQVEGFGLPIWLTEFDCPNPPNVADELQFMSAVLPSLDSNPKVQRYAWFTARATNVGTIPSLLTNLNGDGTGDALTNIGVYYNSAGDCMTNVSGTINVAPCPFAAPPAFTTTTSAPPHSAAATSALSPTTLVITLMAACTTQISLTGPFRGVWLLLLGSVLVLAVFMSH